MVILYVFRLIEEYLRKKVFDVSEKWDSTQ